MTAPPVARSIAPAGPEAEPPVDRATGPLSPLARPRAASGVWIWIAPLVVPALSPAVTAMAPPVPQVWRPAVTCNESFPPIFAELGGDAADLVYEPGDVEGLTARLGRLLDRTPAERTALGERLRGIVERDHEVDALMARLVEGMGRP